MRQNTKIVLKNLKTTQFILIKSLNLAKSPIKKLHTTKMRW